LDHPVTTVDPDGPGPYEYDVAPHGNPLPAWASVDPTTGSIQGTPTDEELTGGHILRVFDGISYGYSSEFTLPVAPVGISLLDVYFNQFRWDRTTTIGGLTWTHGLALGRWHFGLARMNRDGTADFILHITPIGTNVRGQELNSGLPSESRPQINPANHDVITSYAFQASDDDAGNAVFVESSDGSHITVPIPHRGCFQLIACHTIDGVLRWAKRTLAFSLSKVGQPFDAMRFQGSGVAFVDGQLHVNASFTRGSITHDGTAPHPDILVGPDEAVAHAAYAYSKPGGQREGISYRMDPLTGEFLAKPNFMWCSTNNLMPASWQEVGEAAGASASYDHVHVAYNSDALTMLRGESDATTVLGHPNTGQSQVIKRDIDGNLEWHRYHGRGVAGAFGSWQSPLLVPLNGDDGVVVVQAPTIQNGANTWSIQNGAGEVSGTWPAGTGAGGKWLIWKYDGTGAVSWYKLMGGTDTTAIGPGGLNGGRASIKDAQLVYAMNVQGNRTLDNGAVAHTFPAVQSAWLTLWDTTDGTLLWSVPIHSNAGALLHHSVTFAGTEIHYLVQAPNGSTAPITVDPPGVNVTLTCALPPANLSAAFLIRFNAADGAYLGHEFVGNVLNGSISSKSSCTRLLDHALA
jgi:hypothetical protein